MATSGGTCEDYDFSDQNKDNPDIIKFQEGNMEGGNWEIEINSNIDGDYLEICKHCIKIDSKHPKWIKHHSRKQFILPRAVISIASWDGNTICLDYILEAVNTHERLKQS
jgi:hypothetical protein